MSVLSPLGRRRPRSRKALWQAARHRLPASSLAALTAFSTPGETVAPYPYVDVYDPDESRGGPLRPPPLGSRNVPGMGQGDDVVDALLGEVDEMLADVDGDDNYGAFWNKWQERAEERRSRRRGRETKRDKAEQERQDRARKEWGLRERRLRAQAEIDNEERWAAKRRRDREEKLAEMRFAVEKAKLDKAMTELRAAQARAVSTQARAGVVSGENDDEDVQDARRVVRVRLARTRAAERVMDKFGDDTPLERRAKKAGRAATARLDPKYNPKQKTFLTGLVEGLRSEQVADAEARFDAARRREAAAVSKLDQAEEDEAFGASPNEVRVARRAKKVASHAAKEATAVRKKAAEAVRAARLAAKVKKVERRTAKRAAKPTKVGAGHPMQPIFDPAHNLREASKQMILLEDHLFQPPRRCHDCIRKHMLTAEGLAEEAATLDKEGEWKAWTAVLPKQYREWLGALESDRSAEMKGQIAGQVREIRKKLVTALGNAGKIGVVEQPSGSPASTLSVSPEVPRRRLRRVGAVSEALVTVDVADADRTMFRVRSNGNIEPLSGPLTGETIKPSDPFHAELVSSLIEQDGRVEKVLGARAVTQAKGAVNPYIEGLAAKDAVMFGYVDQSGAVVSWRPGEVASVGDPINGTEVVSIPQDGWVPLYFQTADQVWRTKWVKGSNVVRLAKGKRASSVLGKQPFPIYKLNGGLSTSGGVLNEQQLGMADLIQAVMQAPAALGDPFRHLTVTTVEATPEARLSMLSKVIAAALVNAGYESEFKAGAMGDIPKGSPKSAAKAVGLFQLHEGGVGRGMTVAQRQNPIVNTEKIVGEFIAKMNQPGTAVHRLTLAEATARSPSQAPTVADWTDAWTVDVEQPWERVKSGRVRARTAQELFPSGRRFAPAAAASLVKATVLDSPLAVKASQLEMPAWDNPWVVGTGAVALLALGATLFGGGQRVR